VSVTCKARIKRPRLHFPPFVKKSFLDQIVPPYHIALPNKHCTWHCSSSGRNSHHLHLGGIFLPPPRSITPLCPLVIPPLDNFQWDGNRPLNILFLTWGSRGDHQPNIALGLELAHQDYNVNVMGMSNYPPWIKRHLSLHYLEIVDSNLWKLAEAFGQSEASTLYLSLNNIPLKVVKKWSLNTLLPLTMPKFYLDCIAPCWNCSIWPRHKPYRSRLCFWRMIWHCPRRNIRLMPAWAKYKVVVGGSMCWISGFLELY
jgi:hypothetical protein